LIELEGGDISHELKEHFTVKGGESNVGTAVSR